MKNYTKLIITLAAIVTLSAELHGYPQTVNNYTDGPITVTWYFRAIATPTVKQLQPYSPDNQDWRFSFGSGAGCLGAVKVEGPHGIVSKDWGCSGDFSVYYYDGKYHILPTGSNATYFVNNDTIPLFITYNVKSSTLFTLAPGQKSQYFPGPIKYITVMTPGSGGGQTRSVFDFNDETGINKVKTQAGYAFMTSHPNFPISAGIIGLTRNSFSFSGYGYENKTLPPTCQDTLPWGNPCAGQ